MAMAHSEHRVNLKHLHFTVCTFYNAMADFYVAVNYKLLSEISEQPNRELGSWFGVIQKDNIRNMLPIQLTSSSSYLIWTPFKPYSKSNSEIEHIKADLCMT